MVRLRRQLSANRWLDPHNRYQKDVVSSIRRHAGPRGRIYERDLSEYIAVSALLHCFDGWSFLGRAWEAEMAGDPGAARHLGYYAELRAAMSALASQGVGVFDDIHFVVDDDGACSGIRRGGKTHQFVWLALKHWASDKASDVLFRVVALSGISLAEWLEQFHPSGSGVRALAVDLIEHWGLDLELLAADRDDRNIASYRPTFLVSSNPRPIGEVVQSATEFWKLCEPTESSQFSGIDGLLLRHSLEFVFQRSRPEPRSPRQAPNQYLMQVDRMLDGLSLPDQLKESFRKNLDPNRHRAQLLSDARARGTSNDIDRSKQVLSRATLLLRLATGCAKELVGEIGTDARDLLKFWWAGSFVNRRLWPGSPPDLLGDLWTDAEDAIEDIGYWLSSAPTAKSRFEFWNQLAKQAATLSATERICLWGLGL